MFARYTELAAIEYRASESDSPALRIYHFHGGKAQGYFDGRGRQPAKGGWRTPVPFARISSRFDMHRMHPVLHVVKPHNGVDFAASSGTPVYAAGPGRVLFAGDSGAGGNTLTIQHPGNIITGYAHLSRFAPHMKPGQAVETRQVIGYVGSTGRSTGPHLHFSARRAGVFIDPLTLKLDGERVLPKSDRDDFEQMRAQVDPKLDAIELLVAPDAVRAKPSVDAGEGEEQAPLDDDKP